jgi:hypothetical protein
MEALAFLRVDVQQDRVVHLADRLEQPDERFEVVTVYRPEVGNVHTFEQLAGGQDHTDALFRFLQGVFDAAADAGQVFENILRRRAQVLVRMAEPDLGEVLGDRPHRRVDGHAVVVEHDEHLPLDGPGFTFERAPLTIWRHRPATILGASFACSGAAEAGGAEVGDRRRRLGLAPPAAGHSFQLLALPMPIAVAIEVPAWPTMNWS